MLVVLLGSAVGQSGCAGTLAGGNAIAFSLDSSSSISAADYREALSQVTLASAAWPS